MRPITTTGAGRSGDLMKEQSLAPAVAELWNTWEIHTMILLSLFLQVFLFLFSGKRTLWNSTLGQMILWLAYLSADSVATFVLGHLAVRTIEPSDQKLIAFWAPFVLVHLGGQDTMTAFSMQDNELWKRHLLNLVIQAVIASYVVGKASWPDRRLKAALVLVFIYGFLKYAERALYLFHARPKFLKSPLSWKLYGQGHTTYEDKRKTAIDDMEEALDRLSKGGTERPQYMEAYKLTIDIMAEDAPLNTVQSITLVETGKLPDMLTKFLSRDDHHNAYEYVEILLAQCYSLLYTKGYARETIVDELGRRFLFSPKFAHKHNRTTFVPATFVGYATGFNLFPYVTMPIALGLFAAAEKGDPLLHSRRGRVDIMVSYVLLVGAIVLDVSSAVSFILSRIIFKCCSRKKQWCQKLNQYNMINSANISTNKFLRNVREKCSCKRDAGLSMPMKKFILDTLLVSGTRKEWNIASTRGQLALLHHRETTTTTTIITALEESVRSGVDFPRSVLIWHIATEICFHYSEDMDAATTYSADRLLKKHCYKKMSRELSNYIMYLVFKCGVMLTTYSHVVHDETLQEIAKNLHRREAGVNQGDHKDDVIRKLLHPEEIKTECEESKEKVEEIIKIEHEGESKEDEERDEIVQIEYEELANDDEAAEDHMKKLCQSAEALYSSPVLPRALEVAQELIGIKNEAERWDLIAAVWAEMLFYTAPRCGAAFHAEHLAKGGEFITHVFVLMYMLGPFMPPPGA